MSGLLRRLLTPEREASLLQKQSRLARHAWRNQHTQVAHGEHKVICRSGQTGLAHGDRPVGILLELHEEDRKSVV